MATEELIHVHVTGTDQSTTLPRQEVRSSIAQGKIRLSQLIWSPAANAWKPVRELPDLLPSQRIAPAPQAPKPAVVAAQPKVAMKALIPHVAVAAVPKIAGAAKPHVAVAATPRISAAARAGMQTGRSVVVEDADEGAPIIRWICAVLGVVILALGGINYLLVDRPLASALGQTGFSQASVYAHLGAFMQPKALVIHISTGSAVTRDNLPDFLIALARSTPAPPFGGGVFDRVCLTTGVTSHYTFSGEDWRQLGEMGDEPADRRIAYILDSAGDAGGGSIIPPPVKVSGQFVNQRDRAWAAFVNYFTAP